MGKKRAPGGASYTASREGTSRCGNRLQRANGGWVGFQGRAGGGSNGSSGVTLGGWVGLGLALDVHALEAVEHAPAAVLGRAGGAVQTFGFGNLQHIGAAGDQTTS